MFRSFCRKFFALCAVVLAFGCLSPPPLSATAVDKGPIPSQDAGSERADLAKRLAARGMVAGSPIMIRIFKSESELELWLSTGDRYELFATYHICNWSGSLGPKLHEGDRQAPEGLYTVGLAQIHRKGRWPRSLNIGYPNTLDRAHGRTGSLILVHGGCSSIGCYAMTNPVMEQIYVLAEQALENGQARIPVQVFPFRMTADNLANHAKSQWHDFWLNLKEAYDAFERTRMPPRVRVCGKRYVVSDGAYPGEEASLAAQQDCQPVEAIAVAGLDDGGDNTKHGRKAASKVRGRSSAGRNARKAYAAARRARVAAHARRTRTTAMAPSKRTEH